MKNYSNEIAELELLIAGVKKQYSELEIGNALKVKEVLDSYFNPFQELEIRVHRGSSTFHLKDEEGFNKEIFSVYFDERYKEVDELRLSYYSTSTHSDFELKRLVYLGKVASIIRSRSEIILKEVHQVIKSDLGRSNELYSFQLQYERKIIEYKKAESDNEKVQVELLLKGDGIVFDQNVFIEFKRSYAIKVIQLKMVDISKSGKTCTMMYTTRDGFQTREENCNVENILNQVVYFHKNIVQELLPA